MAYNPPTNENINFLKTGVKDVFPTVYDAGAANVPDKFTKVWAEYHNKIRNFIGIVEPMCSPNTAQDEGISGLTYWTLNPAPTINDIIIGSAVKAYNLGKAPPSHMFPFEIVITKSTDNYQNWSKRPGLASTPLLYQKLPNVINKITLNDFFAMKPMVTCCLKSTNEEYYSTRWTVNSYCIHGTDTLLIRGAIMDLNGTSIPTSTLPTINSLFPDGEIQKLHVTILGVRP